MKFVDVLRQRTRFDDGIDWVLDRLAFRERKSVVSGFVLLFVIGLAGVAMLVHALVRWPFAREKRARSIGCDTEE